MVFEAIRKEIKKRQHTNEEWGFLQEMIDKKEINKEKLPLEIKQKLLLLQKIEKKIKLDLEKNQNFQKLWKILKNIKGNFWIVGGYTRDTIAGLKPKDIDIVTNIDIKDLEKILSKNSNLKLKKVGMHFGVLLAEIEGIAYEIATLRKDKDNNGFKPGTLEEDWERRDFDINSIYYNLRTNKLEDFIDKTGIENAIKRQFQFQGKAEERIKEDPMRVLRVFKLEKKGFKPSKKTKAIARKMFSHMIKNTNENRLLSEFEKLIFS